MAQDYRITKSEPLTITKFEPLDSHDTITESAPFAPPRQQEMIDRQQGKVTPGPITELTDWLPAAGGAAGAAIGGTGGTVLGFGVGGVPGAIGGAAVGGAFGESTRQLINRFFGAPDAAPTTGGEAAGKILGQAAIQGGSEGAGRALFAGAKAFAPGLMQSAVKPGLRRMTDVVRGRAAVPRVVQTLLDEGINVTPAGLEEVTKMLDATNDEIRAVVKNTPGHVYPEEVIERVAPVESKFGNQPSPTEDLNAIRGKVEDFLVSHGGGVRRPEGGVMGPFNPINIPKAQDLKVGGHRAIGSRGYAETKGAALEAEKGLTRGLKEGIERASAASGTDIKALNARDSRLIEAQQAIGERVALAGNRDPGGISYLANNPKSVMAYILSRSPAAKSLIARGLYKSTAQATKVPENVIRFAVAALATQIPRASHQTEPDR